MVAIGRSSHAYFFDGVSDSIIIPQGRFRKTGTTNPQGNKVSINTLDSSDDRTNINRKNDSEFIIESWVIPDCGGIIASRDGQFTLEMGTVDTPGPAVFTIATESMQGQSLVKLTTAFDVTTRWDGIVYPQQEHAGMHFSYNRYDSSAYNEATNLNFNNRPLYHVVAGLSKGSVFLAINGETVASQTVSEDVYVARSTSHVYIGGQGGQFRGAIEAIHMTNDYDEEMALPHIPVKGNHTAALYRFEEPIDIIEESYSFSAFTAASNGTTTTLTIPAADAQALIARLTGKAYDSTSSTTDFRATPYSMGNYKLTDYFTSPTSPTTIATAHTPYNLLINPGAVNRNSHKPNLSPPERVRLHSINGSSGVITVSSIHVDFINGTNGLRGVLHSRTADVDNYFVVVGADLLIDNGTGKPYQPPHYGTQIFDKTGQMTIDESNFENHGFVYSSRMATTTSDPNNPFAVNWPATIDELFQIGHSGRHVYSHITGHDYMRRFPKPTDLILDQQIDGSADIVEMVYDNSTKSIKDMFTMNGLVDFYNPAINAPIIRVKNTSSVAAIINNGLPAAQRELIAIGGSGFDYALFALKGPVPEYGDINDTTRLYHLVPETKSRVALLHLPALKASHDYAPFVEIHYNAIDLTGASMGVSGPMLMVEKTVPASSHLISGSTRILDVITTDLANATLYSPGGIVTIGSAIDGFGASLEDSHTLLGDNTGGQENDSELDYSTTPVLYTPDDDATAIPASPPKAIARSHNSGVHESVYHKLCIEPRTSTAQNTKTDSDNIGNFTLQPLTEKSGTGVFDIGPTSSSTSHFEIFDIIDNIRIYDEVGVYCKLFVQPSNKLRSNQLSSINTSEVDTVPNIAGILTLMSRCRIRGVRTTEDTERNANITTVLGKGIADSFVNENVTAIGSGSPDSHILKEIEPNAPVVTVNLGGPGQGAVNTKPTFDPSPLMRLPGSTRRNCVVQAVFIDTTDALTHNTLSVTPLNNGSPDMQSWGTICFPKVGRIYLEDGASAAYTSKLGAGFYFDGDNSDAIQEGRFLDAAGVAYATIHEWANATGLYTQGTAGDFQISAYISNDPNFDNSNLVQDGSTVNDRLFQSMDGVTHDYQLGTQYASTRAMVEIPVFPKQFFDHTAEAIFPGPDNSMKLHIDATYTAHTWNPSPVGRRADDIEVSDKSAYSAYSYIVKNKDYVKSATITKVEEVSNDLRLFVSHPKMFPDGSGEQHFGNLEARKTRRRVFLSTGDWGVYDNTPSSNGYISIPLNASGGYSKGLTETFRQNATVGTKIHIGAGIINETLVPIASDLDTPSSDYEGRSPFYYDSANMQTQGGNLDYGLRQYASAVEFKAGPLANPHASRIENKRASAKIVNVQSTVTSGVTHLVITLDDASLFPDIELSSTVGALEAGDKIYVGEIGTATAVECYYLGRDALAQTAGNENSILAILPGNTSVTLTDLIGVDFTLLRAGHTLKAISDPANAIGTYELGLNTFLPPTAEKWAPSVASSAGTVTEFNIAPTTATRIASANTIGLNIRRGDKLFGLAGSTYTYIGEVSEVQDPTYSFDSKIIDSTCDTDHTSGSGTTFGDNPKIVKCDSTARFHVGMLVTGTGIPSGSTVRITAINSSTLFTVSHDTDATNNNQSLTFTGDTRIKLTAANTGAIATNQTIVIGAGSVMQDDQDAILNRSWLYPYAQGGLRNGDTVWMNMTMNNPHAIEGLFAKSRGVLNEAHVYTGFNGGRGSLTARPRDSIPLENFLIGNSCLETAQNFVQHVNKTVEMNYEAFGLTATQAPTVAYVDPYLATDGHARVLLFDVAHDREFIALHDIHMQVQSGATTPTIGHTRDVAHAAGTLKLDKHLISINGGAPHYFTTQLDVANGFPSENKFLRSTQQSKFIESAYAHNIPSMTSKDLTGNSGGSKTTYTLDDPATLGNNPHRRGKGHGHFVHTGLYHEATSDIHSVGDSTLPRVEPAVASVYWSNQKHKLSFKRGTGNLLLKQLKSHRMAQGFATHTLRDTSTMFDTPDGTRVISAFLCLKGKRNTTLDLSNHEENTDTNRKINSLKHWTEMDFVRRMTVDMGEVGVKEGVTDIEAAAREIVRVINQGGALNGRTHARRPSQQYPGESTRLDLTRIGVRADTADENRDASSAHINADFAATGSTYDPSPFWDGDVAFETHDRGSHMGYVRAHLGRVVEDINGNEGFSIVIHSTIPGASGRNFCVWLDNSKGQSAYQPQFLLGHGGRFRNFWAQPDEMMGENMHPAPMPLNKHGRPFAPVTTLRELVPQEEPDEPFTSNHDIGPRRDNVSNPVQRNVSAHLGGISQNTVNDESFESQSPSSSLLKGLRAGKGAIARVNFGGLIASGVPGFSPIAGKHGLGRKGSTEFDKIYGEAIKKGTTGSAGTSPTAITSYSAHVKDTEIREDAIGNSTLYGLRFSDHRGRGYGLRYIYRQMGEKFANDLTTIPSTLDDEVCIFFDDRDVAQGGFTIGQHMLGWGDATGRMDISGLHATEGEVSWRGNQWRGVPAPSVGIDSYMQWTGTNLTLTLEEPYHSSSSITNHPDILGYLGFPKENGVIQVTDPFTSGANRDGSTGTVLSYESRTQFGRAGTHKFHGVRGPNGAMSHKLNAATDSATLTDSDSDGTYTFQDNQIHRVLITPRINWTCLITDEVIAAATAHAINLQNPNTEEGFSFDCTNFYAADGKTFGEWGVSPDAIKIRAHNPQRGAVPLSTMFSATLHKDLGIEAPHVEFGAYEKLDKSTNSQWTVTRSNALHDPLSDNDIDANAKVDCGYIPRTVLQIQTKSRGYHTNTPTPILVDSYNDPVDTTTWANNLKGISYLSISGDHILPKINNPIVMGSYDHTGGTVEKLFSLNGNENLTHLMLSAGTEAATGGYSGEAKILSFGEEKKIWYGEKQFATAIPVKHTTLGIALTTFTVANQNEDWLATFSGSGADVASALFMLHGDKQFSGYRQYGSIESEPITYFKGGRDSNDHSVPLYFGGGFSGVVLDINDGTKNDYSSFYTHPYSTGPTGTAGIQNANEISTSFAMLDCNAILAFFPGTAFLNQHRGSSTPPAFNKTAILSPDLEVDNYSLTANRPSHLSARYTAGIVPQKAVPLVVRFPHQNANYTDHKTSNNYFTSYLIFGPGQSFPFTETTDANDNIEPHPGYVVTTGNTWSKMPHGVSLPNEIKNSDNKYGPPSSTYQSRRQRFQHQYTSNWSPPEGLPNVGDVLFTDATCVVTNTSAVIDMTSTAKLVVGMTVSGTGIQSGSIITIINSPSRFTIGKVATAGDGSTPITLTFTFGTSRYGLGQRPEHGYHYGQHFENPVPGKVNTSNEEDYLKAHPYQHAAASYYGIAMSADLTWHMDGGYLPGGNWLDQQMSFNPPMEKSDYRVVRESVVGQMNQTAFRASGVLGATWLAGASNEDASHFFRDTILVDATRCQNGEELACILGQAINENPGSGALKALGGTFAPSMGTAHRQDRYGWVELTYTAYSANNGALNESNSSINSNDAGVTHSTSTALTFDSSVNYVMAKGADGTSIANQTLLEQLPASGWIRTDKGGRLPSDPTGTDAPTFGCYHSREVFTDGSHWYVIFNLAPNRISGMPFLEDITTWDNKCDGTAALSFPNLLGTGALDIPTKVYVWSKSGVNTFMNNVGDRGALYPRSRVHFSGLVDAIDRTRPIGAVGWAGERYSYLNSLAVGGNLYSGGLGAWHPMLGFSPYGKASSVMSTFAHQPHIAPIKYAPESTGPLNGWGTSDTVLTTPYTWNTSLASTAAYSGYTGSTTPYVFENTHVDNYGSKPIHITTNGTDVIPKTLHQNQGVFSRGFLVISYEGELPLVAKRDRDGITGMGDWLAVKSKTLQSVAAATALTFAGTTQWKERIHDSRRFVAPANGGPNIEALTVNEAPSKYAPIIPVDVINWNANISADTSLVNATPCVAATGDLFFDLDESPGSFFLESTTDVERNIATDFIDQQDELKVRYGPSYTDGVWLPNINPHYAMRNRPADNFTIENVVWKRMDGGNLSLPASNARGLGAVPFVTRIKSDGTAYTMGEELLGNNRFTFETTNSAMFPIIQAQELSHPQLASQHPNELRNVLTIPNEEIQFEEIMVEDDTGQTHIIEGGSPFGTIIRTYNTVSDRSAEGLAPSVANSGTEPNLKIRLPDPDTIPGNLIIRPGFGALQAYQTETIGSGGMMRPISKDSLKHLFTDETTGPRLGPTFSDHNWEHISQAATGEAFPDSTYKGWEIATGNAPLETSYELHDRTLFFHVTKNGNSHSHRYPYYYGHTDGVLANELTAVSFSGTTLTVNANPLDLMYDETAGPGDARRFLRLYDPTTGKSGVASFLDTGTNTFTDCVGDADFQEIVKGTITSYKVVPSYYIPAGSTRFFAARRMRDHAEVSGNSPDTAHTLYYAAGSEEIPKALFTRPQLTPLAIPRMGHHFVTPTMAMLPGHWAHPAYQGIYNKHLARRSATLKSSEYELIDSKDMDSALPLLGVSTDLTNQLHGYDTQMRFGSLSATPSGPSDIHGGAFTLMFETKVRSDGYGVLASEGQAGVVNSKGGHTVVLEAAATYTLKHHFPDPSEVGAYQIIIQPNVHKSQLLGFHANGGATALPNGSVNELTSQQVGLVIGIREPDSATGAMGLVLAEATMADTRGCEIFINELMIDHDPDHMSQFTNIPPLMTYNPLGVQSTESPAFVKNSLPYTPSMFIKASPGFSTNIPWWSIVHRVGPDDSTAYGFRHLTHHKFDNYYEFIRSSTGSIGCQITLAGYPSTYPDIYHEILENISLNPVCTFVSLTSSTVIKVDDARGFPKVPYYGNKLEYTDADGVRRTHTYTERSGYDATNMNKPLQFTITANSAFTSNLTAGTKIRLTRAYDFRPSGSIFTDSKTSMVTRVLPQMLQGSRDTNSLHMADAYLSMWHPNLGRPHTFYSDSSRTWLSPTSDRAVLKKPLNSMPEHFETIHYHDSTYYASLGPFTLRRKTPQPPYQIANTKGASASAVGGSNVAMVFATRASDTSFTVDALVSIEGTPNIMLDGKVYSVASINAGTNTITTNETLAATITADAPVMIGGDGSMITAQVMAAAMVQGRSTAEYTHQGGQSDSSDAATVTMLNHFWPSGSRGGPLVSRLDGYGYVSTSWDFPREYTFDGPVWTDADDDGSYVVDENGGLTKTSYDSISNPTRVRPFGYRFGLRQPYNKPQWSTYGARAFRESAITATNASVSYQHGPLIQQESQPWTYAGGSAGVSNPTYGSNYVGIMERQTNFSGMLGVDKSEMQVRYSNGMRVTRPFGCPVRTLRNETTVIRDWWGDDNGLGLTGIEQAAKYYLVDWWGNTRGEDVRRYPVRGFGIKPAWDSADVYEYDRTTNRTPFERLFNNASPVVNFKHIVTTAGAVSVTSGYTIPRFGGRVNNTNNNSATTLVDVFMPTNAHRVGDNGKGHGLRYPTAFNEDLLTELNEPIHGTGVVLSHHTAEPNMEGGYIRARDDVLQPDEVPRGISARLAIAEDGLLKPEAVVSDRVEKIDGDSPHKDAVSRSSPRIGLDTENVEGVDENMIIINTEAHSLHTDRNVGQRVVLQGGMQTGSQTLADYDLTALNFGGQPQGGAIRLSHTSNFNPLGGTFLAETRNFISPIDDSNWGGFTDATCDYNNDPTIVMDSTAKLVVGMTVTGTGIPSGATVASITDATNFELSASTTGGAVTNGTLSFGPPTAMGSNPYATSVFTTAGKRANTVDKKVTYMMRPVRLLDKQHAEMFRSNLNLHSSSPQYGSNYFGATAGGKYGLYVYQVENGRATGGGVYMRSTSPDTNPPYAPAYLMDISASDTVPMSKGPKIKGTEVTGFDKTLLDNEVTRVIISENSLQHHRADASRRRSHKEGEEKETRLDYTVQPRFSQSLHQKGHKGDVTYNSTDHSGDGA